MARSNPGPIVYTYLHSPVGQLLLAGTPEGVLTCVSFPAGDGAVRPDPEWVRDKAAVNAAAIQIQEYFAGRRRHFSIPLALEGTPFQVRVWKALTEIPYGQTRTYGDIARLIGAPAAVRAVGLANGQNPLPIVVPCHRVIGKDGSLTGYGGGLNIKRALLDLERGSLFFLP